VVAGGEEERGVRRGRRVGDRVAEVCGGGGGGATC